MVIDNWFNSLDKHIHVPFLNIAPLPW